MGSASDGTGRAARGDDFLAQRLTAELPSLFRVARHLTGDDHEAEGALQDAVERAWRGREQLRDRQAAGAWFRSILARTVVDRYRRRRALPAGGPDAFESMLPDIADPQTVVEAAHDEAKMRAALRQLSVEDRLAVVLHDGEGWPAAELAPILGGSTDAAHKRIQRARSRLVQVFDEGTPPPGCPSSGCEDARGYAHALLDGSLEDADRAVVQAHLDSCPCCPAAIQAAAGVLTALSRQEPNQPVPEAVRTRLHELVRSAAATS